MDGDEVVVTFDSLPSDATLHVLMLLDLQDVVRCSAVSRTFRISCNDEHIWKAMLETRGLRTPLTTASSYFHEFQAAWLRTMDLIESVGMVDAKPSAAVPQESAALVASAPMVCGVSQSFQVPAGNRGIDPQTFVAAVQKLDGIARDGGVPCTQEPRGYLLLIDWLRTAAAQKQPLLCLSILAALQEEAPQRWLAVCEDVVRDVREVNSYDERKAAAREHLQFPRSLPSSLRGEITLRWSTWSQLRDCRGFRARDDRHRRSATLLQLLQQPEAEVWSVLARGEGHEISKLSLHEF